MTEHLHSELHDWCFRCQLGREEVAAHQVATFECFAANHPLVDRFGNYTSCYCGVNEIEVDE